MGKFQIVGIPASMFVVDDKRWCSACQQWTIHEHLPKTLATLWECTVCRHKVIEGEINEGQG